MRKSQRRVRQVIEASPGNPRQRSLTLPTIDSPASAAQACSLHSRPATSSRPAHASDGPIVGTPQPERSPFDLRNFVGRPEVAAPVFPKNSNGWNGKPVGCSNPPDLPSRRTHDEEKTFASLPHVLSIVPRGAGAASRFLYRTARCQLVVGTRCRHGSAVRHDAGSGPTPPGSQTAARPDRGLHSGP